MTAEEFDFFFLLLPLALSLAVALKESQMHSAYSLHIFSIKDIWEALRTLSLVSHLRTVHTYRSNAYLQVPSAFSR